MQNSKKIALATGALGLLILTGNGCGNATTPTADNSTVQPAATITGFKADDQMSGWGIKFQYPQTWQKTEDNQTEGMLAINLALPEDKDLGTPGNFTLTFGRLDPNLKLTLNDVATKSKASLEKQLTDLQYKDEGSTKVGGQDAKRVSYTGTLNLEGGSAEMKGREIYFAKNGVNYTISFAAVPDFFDQYQPQAEQIINSIELK